MEEKTSKIKCPTCGHAYIVYRFTLNKGLVAVLRKFFEAGGPVNIGELKLTNSQYSNYPKLAYWGLAHKLENEDIKGGRWEITSRGIVFILNRRSVPKTVFIKNKEIAGFGKQNVWFKDVSDGYEYQGQYRRQVLNQLGVGDKLQEQFDLFEGEI